MSHTPPLAERTAAAAPPPTPPPSQALRNLIGDQAHIISWEDIYGPNWQEEMSIEAAAAGVSGFAPTSPRFQELSPSPSQPVKYGPGLQAPPDSPPPSEWRCDPCHALRVASAEKQALWVQDAPPTVAARIPLSEHRHAQSNAAAGTAELEAQVARCREALAAVPSPARHLLPAK